MKIIIAGAGDVGFHLADLLTKENQDIVLIDTNQEVLDYAESHLDVMTLWGDSTSIEVLKKANPADADLLLAVTTSQKTNLMTAILAKKMGVTKTIARVSNKEYLEPEQLATFEELGVDHLISPRQLAAIEIRRLVQECSFTDIFEFEDGKLNLVGLTLDAQSPLVSKKLGEANGTLTSGDTKPLAIVRGQRTLIPTDDTILREHDYLYCITLPGAASNLTQVMGKKIMNIRNVMILGGGGLAKDTVSLLENKFHVTLIEKDKERCKYLAGTLDNTLIINGDYSNMELLVEEGLDNTDAFIALTDNFETNIISSLAAKNHGVKKTIAQVENREYVHISQNIGVDTLINRKLIAANNIFRYVRKGKIKALTTLHGVDTEVIEFELGNECSLAGKTMEEIKLPKGAIVGGVIRGEKSLIPHTGDFRFQVNDKVIILSLQESLAKLQRIFQ